ncbi:calcium/proton exchanger [Ammoniphilus resinae]|uniref:Ca(2+)/H(+) antiporter n=1 Tax=Ammoniphilus resinae TaxID=861532 RepID=A0ABS4GNH9_9BACL|nr:calcium/proton exchanger [Ammoniphilus resinae]MBP1931612.1 Ca2+:H+ antiporter [Ammoniphilus resinae]
MKPKLLYTIVIFTVLFSTYAHFFTSSSGLQFFSTSLAIIFLAGLLGKATETVAHFAGERLGGFLNATFGNAAELIIAIFLVREGLFDMVKASITGSIIGNLLLVLGLSIFAGGLKFKQQKFNPLLAGHNASLMLLGVIALFIPAAFARDLSKNHMDTFSLVVAGALIVAYFLWLIFSMITHKTELSDDPLGNHEQEEEPLWGKGTAILILVVATVFVAIQSEWLVHSIQEVALALGWSELFVGAFVVAIVGNAAEHSAAVFMALKNKIGGAMEIAVGSSLQIALLVGPLLVFISLFFGQPMDILFTMEELVAIGVAVFIAISISRDGMTNWFEGILLFVVYLLIGTAFYFV